MGVELFRGRDTLPPLPTDRTHEPGAIDEWLRRCGIRIGELVKTNDFLDAGCWAQVLDLAQCYGWMPAGTVLDDPQWNGDYTSNDGARVEAEDARGLEQALALALDDPDLGVGRWPVASPWDVGANEVDGALNLLRDADDRAMLEEYVTFLKRGSFTIE
jgi:hypothetical protein